MKINKQEVTNVNVDLYADEKELAKKQAEMVSEINMIVKEQADYERRKQIPGLLSANEMPSEVDQF